MSILTKKEILQLMREAEQGHWLGTMEDALDTIDALEKENLMLRAERDAVAITDEYAGGELRRALDTIDTLEAENAARFQELDRDHFYIDPIRLAQLQMLAGVDSDWSIKGVANAVIVTGSGLKEQVEELEGKLATANSKVDALKARRERAKNIASEVLRKGSRPRYGEALLKIIYCLGDER